MVGEGDGGHEDEDEDGDEGGDEDGVEGRAARMSDYLRLEDVFGRVGGSLVVVGRIVRVSWVRWDGEIGGWVMGFRRSGERVSDASCG